MQVTSVRHMPLLLAIFGALAAVSLFAQTTLIEQGRAAIGRGDGSGMLGVAKYASKVKDEFEKAVALDPRYVEARFGLVQLYASAPGIMGGSYEKALKKYVAYTPKENEPMLANAHDFLGDIYEKQGRKPEAKQAYQAALKLNPGLTKASEAMKRVS